MTQSVLDFFAAWAIADDAARDAQVAATLADTIFYADPRTPEPLTTAADVTAYVGQFSKMAPGMDVAVVHTSLTLNFERATVQFGSGERSQTGQYTADLDADGKITRLVGFVGMGTPE